MHPLVRTIACAAASLSFVLAFTDLGWSDASCQGLDGKPLPCPSAGASRPLENQSQPAIQPSIGPHLYISEDDEAFMHQTIGRSSDIKVPAVTDCRTIITKRFSNKPQGTRVKFLNDDEVITSVIREHEDPVIQRHANTIADSLRKEPIPLTDIFFPDQAFVRIADAFHARLNSTYNTLSRAAIIRWSAPTPGAPEQKIPVFGIIERDASELVSCFPGLLAMMQEYASRLKSAIDDITQKQAEMIRVAALPMTVLGTTYAAYIDVRRCYDARKGYAVGYVSDPEMEQARDAALQIERAVKPKIDKAVSTERVWSRVARARSRAFQPTGDYSYITHALCREKLTKLLRILREQVPESSVIEKDF